MATHAAEQVHRVFARAMLDRARGSVKRSGMRAQDRRVISAVEDILAHLEQYALWFDRAYEAWCIGASPEAEHMQVAESGRLRPSAAACANSGRRGTGRFPRKCKLRGPCRYPVG